MNIIQNHNENLVEKIKLKKKDHIKGGEGCGRAGTLRHCWSVYKKTPPL